MKDSWAHQILQRAHEKFKWPIKIWKLHVFEWDMGHWPILRAHHHFGLGLTLVPVLMVVKIYLEHCLQAQQISHLISSGPFLGVY